MWRVASMDARERNGALEGSSGDTACPPPISVHDFLPNDHSSPAFNLTDARLNTNTASISPVFEHGKSEKPSGACITIEGASASDHWSPTYATQSSDVKREQETSQQTSSDTKVMRDEDNITDEKNTGFLLKLRDFLLGKSKRLPKLLNYKRKWRCACGRTQGRFDFAQSSCAHS